jgi:ABC-type polysaccharide/polyol phosphate transport system ATPase subunit
VGDAAFQEKCRNRMDALIKDGRTLLLVSHAGRLLGEVCQRCIYLEGGQIRFDGATDEAIGRYEKASAGATV